MEATIAKTNWLGGAQGQSPCAFSLFSLQRVPKVQNGPCPDMPIPGSLIPTASPSSAWQAAPDFTAAGSPVLGLPETAVESLFNIRCGVAASRENAK